jgi:fructoselysine-6-P-deglycase FrlB-like protein
MAKLWKVTANSNNGKVTKGMSVEILDKNGNKPNQTAIADALNNKYNENIPVTACGSSIFIFEEIK